MDTDPVFLNNFKDFLSVPYEDVRDGRSDGEIGANFGKNLRTGEIWKTLITLVRFHEEKITA